MVKLGKNPEKHTSEFQFICRCRKNDGYDLLGGHMTVIESTGSLSKIKSKGLIMRNALGIKKTQVSRNAKNKTRTLLSLVAVQKSIVFRGAIALVDMSGAGNDLRHMIMEAVDSAV